MVWPGLARERVACFLHPNSLAPQPHRVGLLAKSGLGARAGVGEEVLHWEGSGRGANVVQHQGTVVRLACPVTLSQPSCPKQQDPDQPLLHPRLSTWNSEPLVEELGRRRIHKLMAHEPAGRRLGQQHLA